MHPNHAHMTRAAEDPERELERRIEVARQSGVPARRAGALPGGARGPGHRHRRGGACPTATWCPGWRWRPTWAPGRCTRRPGHAPSHVVLHQPDRGLLLSGDHILGRVSLYYDFGYTPDPAGEFLDSLDVVDGLDVELSWPATAARCATPARWSRPTGARSGERLERVRARDRGRAADPVRDRAGAARRGERRRR